MRFLVLSTNFFTSRGILTFLALLAAVLLQVSFLGPILGFWPFQLAAIAAFLLVLAFKPRYRSILWLGFLAGFLLELFSTLPFGAVALPLMLALALTGYLVLLLRLQTWPAIFLLSLFYLALATILQSGFLFLWSQFDRTVIFSLPLNWQLIFVLMRDAALTTLLYLLFRYVKTLFLPKIYS